MTGEVQWKICSLQQLFINASVWLLAMEVFLCWFLMFQGWYGKQNLTHLLMMTLACIGKRSLNWCILPCNTFLCSGLDWRKQLEPEFKLKGFLLASHEKRSNMHFKKALNLSKDSGYLKKKQQTLGMCASFSWDCTLEQAWRFCQGLVRCCSACRQWRSCCGAGVLPRHACPSCAPFQGVLIYLLSHSRQAFVRLFSYCLTWAICLERPGDLGFVGNVTALGYG